MRRLIDRRPRNNWFILIRAWWAQFWFLYKAQVGWSHMYDGYEMRYGIQMPHRNIHESSSKNSHESSLNGDPLKKYIDIIWPPYLDPIRTIYIMTLSNCDFVWSFRKINKVKSNKMSASEILRLKVDIVRGFVTIIDDDG